MTATPVVTPANLGADFDMGGQVANKINIVAASTTVAGKMRLATTAELTSGASGVGVDAAALKSAIAGVTGGLLYVGSWNALTNTPTLTSGSGTKGNYYKVSAAGTTVLDTNGNWNVGDIAAFNGSVWDKFAGPAEAVTTVAGRIGAITLAAADVSGVATPASVTAQASVTITDAFGNTIGHALP